MVLLGIRKDWVETVATRVGQRVEYPIHWSDPTKAYIIPYLLTYSYPTYPAQMQTLPCTNATLSLPPSITNVPYG